MLRVAAVLTALAAVALAEKQTWHTDIDKALRAAVKTGKPIFAYVFDDT